MGASYVVFGRAIPTYQLALATYAAVAAPIVISKFRKTEAAAPAIQASSQDEEAFIREFIKAAEENLPKNILISVALNVQKYAHNQLQPGANTNAKLHHINPTYVVEEELFDNNCDALQYQSNRPAENSHAVAYSFPSSLNSSRRSSIQTHHRNYETDASDHSETVAIPPRIVTGENISSDSTSMDYLYSKAWWAGMTLMILGECGNFLAYGYAQASIIAPLGTVALVSNVILAPLMLREPFRRRDLLGIVIAIIGTVVVVVNSKENDIKLTPEAVITALLQTQFILYFIVCCILVAVLASLSDTIGSEYIFIDLSIVAIFGGYTVLATKGVSSLLSLSFYKMFKYPIAYLLVFVLVTTAVGQIKYLNKSLQRFDSTQVIPTQFVLFTTSAIIGSAILYNDFDEMDFNKGLHFLTGCCMTFLGVYFITSHRDKDGPIISTTNTDWSLAQQHQYAPVSQRTSFDMHSTNRTLYPQERNRSELLMDQSRTLPQNIAYIIPTRPATMAESFGQNASVPLLGTSLMQSASGSKEQGITAKMQNALAAVGSRHTSRLGLEQVMENYGAPREDRRGSIASLNQSHIHLQRPGLGSRSNSACSGMFPPPAIANYPSSTSLAPPDHNYGSSFQTHHMPPQSTPMQFARVSAANTADPRYQVPSLQERAQSHEVQPKLPRQKKSSFHLPKEQTETKEVREGLPPKIKTTGVTVPGRRGDRHMYTSPSEQDFVAEISRSIDSFSSPNPIHPAKLLPGSILSASPTKHTAQGSEYAFQTLKSPITTSIGAADPNTMNTSAALVSNDQDGAASLPPLPVMDTGHHSQPDQRRTKKKKRGSMAYDSDSSSILLQQTRRKESPPKDNDLNGQQ
ncbi:hypothetical protein BGZ50_004708 [Haplosporangium sp. Z 11]|nr:hypothetical protein BGZ50_004708 [Haplosporangium sp. Z 11]